MPERTCSIQHAIDDQNAAARYLARLIVRCATKLGQPNANRSAEGLLMHLWFRFACSLFFSRSHPMRRPLVKRVVRAFTDPIHYIKTKKEDTNGVIGKNLKSNDPEGLERAYLAYNPAFPEVPYPSAEGLETVLDDIAPHTQKVATADPKSFVDMSFVQELETSEFIKQLYKR
jgi:hypothetical protein